MSDLLLSVEYMVIANSVSSYIRHRAAENSEKTASEAGLSVSKPDRQSQSLLAFSTSVVLTK